MNKENSKDILEMLFKEIRDIKKQLLINFNPVSNEWIRRDHVMEYLGYADTQMGTKEKEYNLIVAKIGKRKFYHRDSIVQMLESATKE